VQILLIRSLIITLCLFFCICLQPVIAQIESDTLPSPAEESKDTITHDDIDKMLSAPSPQDTVEEVKEEPLPKIPEDTIVMRFVKKKTLHSPDSLYFNVLKITNNTKKRLTGSVTINIPDSWKLISLSKKRINIAPGKSAYVPVRVALSRETKGGVAYVINASFVTSDGLLLNSDCYISIPRITKWKIYAPKRVIYFAQQVEFEKLELNLENKGNSAELIKLELISGESLTMYGSKEGILVTSISLPPNSDTILTFSVKYLPLTLEEIDLNSWRGSSIKIRAYTQNKTENMTVWFKYLKNSFTNILGFGNTPLNLEVTARNLLASFKPRLDFNVYGTILLQKNREINYRFSNPNIASYGDRNSSEYLNYLWTGTRMYVNYTTKDAGITIGDMGAGIGFMGVSGRGIGGYYNFNNNKISAAAVRNIIHPINAASIEHQIRIERFANIRSGLTYINDEYNKINSALGGIGASFLLFKVHHFNTFFSVSNTQHLYNDSTFKLNNTTYIKTDAPDTTLKGFGYQLNYTSIINKFRFNIASIYGSKYHGGSYGGRFEVRGQVNYSINSRHSTFFRYSRYSYQPIRYLQGKMYLSSFFRRESYDLQLVSRLNPKLSISAGPSIETLYQTRDDYMNDTLVPMGSISERLYIRANYRTSRYNTVTPYIICGFTKINEYADSAFGLSFSDISPFTAPFYNAQVGLYIRRKHWGVSVNYYYGPYYIYNQFSYVYGGNFDKSLRIMPYFEKYFLNNKLKFVSYNSYIYNALSNSERIFLNARLEYFFNKGWSMHVNNNLSFYSRYDEETARKISYRNYYLDVGFKKIFDIPQPRVKYYDLTVICFMDLNGNRAKDENEAGLDYILINIERDGLTDTVQLGNFVYADLATDQFGEIHYNNIPGGNYKLDITPLKDLQDLYNLNGAEQYITIESNTTIYIPFVQTNKISGKIILVRDEFSSEGFISVSDIRVTASDTAGNTYSVLTDRAGKFILFAPLAGRYRVTVNNVFGENFELQQPVFNVDFDGYKEYEIEFRFKEKPRSININGGAGSIPPGRTFEERDVIEESPAPPPDEEETVSTRPEITEPAPPVTPEVTPPSAEVKHETTEPFAPTITWEETGYYIVLASFSNRANAQKYIDKLTSKDNALIVGTPQGNFRVVYAYRTEKEATEDLKEKKSIYPTAWISRKQ
ncbi:MAG: SPOR domain-containing protein, partial [Bacteroidota bacterium]